MGRGKGDGEDLGGAGLLRGDSLNPGEDYAKAVRRLPDAEHAGVSIDTYHYGDETVELRSGAAPFDLESGRVRVFDDHEVYTPSGAWVGADRPVPHRRMTNGALTELGPAAVKELFERYDAGDFGEDGGEVGFANYRVGGETVYLIDDATRSLEGEPPLRDPATSPGPQTVLLSSEY